jgi:putative transposase
LALKEYKKRDQSYPSDLTDAQWAEIEALFSGLREYTWSKRELTDAVLYLVKTGCQWRHLPHDFPPYSTVHSFYRRARINGIWDKILQHLVVKTREDAGRSPEPTYAIIDSQSVKTVAASEERGIDGGKKRKAENGI